jgi:hypothetical protein
LALAAVRDLRELRAPATEDELAAFETDVLSGFVLALEEQRNGQWRYGAENGQHEVGRLPTVVRGHARVITFPQFTSMTRPAGKPH